MMTKGLATSLCYSVVKATAVVAAIGSSTARTDDGVIEEMACFVSFQATEFITHSQNVTMCLFIVIVAGCERKRHGIFERRLYGSSGDEQTIRKFRSHRRTERLKFGQGDNAGRSSNPIIPFLKLGANESSQQSLCEVFPQ